MSREPKRFLLFIWMLHYGLNVGESTRLYMDAGQWLPATCGVVILLSILYLLQWIWEDFK